MHYNHSKHVYFGGDTVQFTRILRNPSFRFLSVELQNVQKTPTERSEEPRVPLDLSLSWCNLGPPRHDPF